ALQSAFEVRQNSHRFTSESSSDAGPLWSRACSTCNAPRAGCAPRLIVVVLSPGRPRSGQVVPGASTGGDTRSTSHPGCALGVGAPVAPVAACIDGWVRVVDQAIHARRAERVNVFESLGRVAKWQTRTVQVRV